ncbi:MAG: hypothetical protein Hyperionvirus5_20 [Hyperionvirus sp.]|uniref:Uncharacterized protein n=1 Tax=Hyperionvirus sp. TaxID=2487770 RepID=A0A3G5A9Q5_9VIRU|nr:MAG: hypothetical protein Hyperionvirus5_20 [Hyperionvirus sp.]
MSLPEVHHIVGGLDHEIVRFDPEELVVLPPQKTSKENLGSGWVIKHPLPPPTAKRKQKTNVTLN